MADQPQTEALLNTKGQELDQLSAQCASLEISISFLNAQGEETTTQLFSYGQRSVVAVFQGSVRTNSISMREAVEKVCKPLRGQSPELTAVAVKSSKSPLSAKEMKRLVIDAWCESLNIAPIPDADIKKLESKKKSRLQDVRASLLADLRGGPKGHESWAHRSNDRKELRHLRDADLHGADLTDCALYKMEDLRASNFDDCQMVGANLSQNDIRECTFRNAKIDSACFQYGKASGANFSGASMVGTNLHAAHLVGANLENCNMAAANLTHCDLRGANLSGSSLENAKFGNTKYDENTRWPADFLPPDDGLYFAGDGKDPFVKQRVQALAPGGKVDFETFVARLHDEFDQERLKKSLKMLKAESFQLFAEVKPDSLVGVVKSQTDADLVYSCRLTDAGAFSCCTQNLNSCGGLRGALCKHLLVLLVGLTKAGELEAASACEWVFASKTKVPKIDKEIMSATFLRYKGAEAGEIDWRPTETMPEDYYAF